MLLNFVLLTLYNEFFDVLGYLEALDQADLAREKEGIVSRMFSSTSSITQRELVVRLGVAANSVIPTYLWGSSYHDFWAVLLIGSGLDEDWEWPPLFRTFADAYSMRRYWGIFWHRLIYRAFSAHAYALSSWFGLPKRGLATRLVCNMLVFAFSAVWHGAVSWQLGNRCAWNRSLMFWLWQPASFVVEGLVQAGWRRLCKTRYIAFERVVGYLWVMVWLFWSTPKRLYPLTICDN
jgi:hypothetical protein